MSPLINTSLHQALARERFDEMERRAADERQASCVARLRHRRRSPGALVRSLLALVVTR